MMSLDSWRQTARRLLALLRRSPVTVGLVAALWLVAIATGSLLSGPTDSLMAQVAVGPPTLAAGRWWTLLTALFWCQGLLSYLTTTVLLLVVGVPAERLLGRRRSALVLLTSQVAGGLVAVGLVALGASVIGSSWNDDPTAFTVVGPSAALTGLGFALTFRLSALWRRRLRLLLGTGVVVMLLYSGTLQDLFRVVDGVVGLVVGLIVLGRATRGSTSAPSRSEAKVLVALAVAATAMGPIITTLLSRQGLAPLGVLQTLLTSSDGDPGDIQDLCTNNPDPAQLAQCRLAQARTLGTGIGSAITSIGLSLVLLAAAEGLRRGRRFAWWLALAFNLALSIGSTLLAGIAMLWLSGGDTADSWLLVFLIPPALVPIAVVGLLAATRKVFTVSAPRRTYRRLGLMLIVSLAATSTVYVLGGYLDRAHFDPVPALGDLLADLPNRFLPPGYTSLLTGFDVSPVFLPTGGLAMVVWEFSGAVFWVILLVGLVVSFWRARLVDDKDAADRARTLIADNGGSSLAHMITWPGNHYWFTDCGRSAMAYRVVATVALTTGGPVGDPALRQEAVRGFETFCRRNGWIPCLYSITDEVRDIAIDLDWKAVQVAEDTVVPLAGLEFTGKKWQDIRTALNKAGKAGITAEWLNYSEAPLSITDQIRVISEEWVADKGMPEMGFTLGGMDELNDPDVRCLIAVDTDRTVHGITSWLPVYRDGKPVGWTLDFMRRRGNGFRGVMEFLIASAAQSLKQEGAEFLSLSGAPLARLDRGEQVTALQRILDVTGKALEPVYGFRSLLSFKAKFQPEYRPLYMAYPDSSTLPVIGNAIGRAYLPEITPSQGLRLLRKLLRLPGHRSRTA